MAEASKARLAFIGCGGFATASIFPNIPLIPHIDLVATCDLDGAKAERNARNFGARRWYTDMHKMLDEEELDGVFVIGPAPQHYELAPVVLKRGLPVYVEKPSANTSAQACELAELAEAHGTWGQCGFMKRFSHVYRMTQSIIDQHLGGRDALTMVSIKFGQGPYPQIWGIDSPKRAFLIGQLCHLFDLTRFIGGNVRAVHAVIHEHEATRVAYLVTLKFASGAIGHLNLNCYENTQGFRDIQERLEVWGVGQSVCVEDMRTVRYLPAGDWMDAVPGTGPFPMTYEPAWTGFSNSRLALGYQGEVDHFARRCLGQVQDGPDLWDSFEALRLGEAIYDSAHSGEWVEIAAR